MFGKSRIEPVTFITVPYRMLRIALRLIIGREKRDVFLKRLGIYYEDITIYNFVFALCNLFRMTYFLNFMPYETEVIGFLETIKGNTFVDVGAFYGFYSIKLHKNFEKIIAIEANPENAERMKENLKKMKIKNVTVVQKAVSERNKQTLPLYIGKHDGRHSLLSEHKLVCMHTCISVNTITLASLLNDIEKVDLVKVDVEGAEWLVLEGAESILNKIDRWIIELHDLKRRRELEKWFSDRHFRHKWLNENHIYAERS